MRIEGVYTYKCSKCDAFFGVVSRFAAKEDYSPVLKCPKCLSAAPIQGEGSIKYSSYQESLPADPPAQEKGKDDSRYTLVLDVNHVAEIMGVSKRVAYEYMDRNDFPLMRIRRRKRVNKNCFFEWLSSLKTNF